MKYSVVLHISVQYIADPYNAYIMKDMYILYDVYRVYSVV